MFATTSHRSIPARMGRGLALLWLALWSSLGAQILDWEAAIAEIGGGISNFTSVQARQPAGSGQPTVALVAGSFQGTFQMGGPTTLNNPSGQDGVVVRLDRDPAPPANWGVAWLLQAASSAGNVSITDLAVDAGGVFYVTGRFSEDVLFAPGIPVDITLSAPGFTSGFVAWGDPDLGTWSGAFEIPGFEPESIALGSGPNPEIYLTGPGTLARLYDLTGTEQWSTPAPAGTTSLTDIALLDDPAAPDLYVLAEDPGLPEGVVLYQLARGDGSVNWQRPMGGAGNETAGGLAVPPDGDPRLAFSTQDSDPKFGPDPIPGLPPINADHALMLRIDPGGNLVWATPLGEAQSPGAAMRPRDVAVDGFGNAFASAGFNGAFLIESPVPELGENDAAILGVDASGLLFDFHRSTGGGIDSPRAIAAPVRDLLITVGSYDHPQTPPPPPNQESIFGGFTLPIVTAGEPHGFFSVAGPILAQQRLILTPVAGGGLTVGEIIELVHQLGGQVYRVIRSNSRGEIALAAFIDDEDIPELQGNPGIELEPDHDLEPAGANADAGWALEHLNDATNTSTAPFTFTYPEPGQTVYLYLLDTAVGSSIPAAQANIDTWFGGNTNLSLEATTLVRGVGDPLVSSVFQHGTEMLSLIGGPTTGAAIGTPIILKNFDFYPTGASTTASLLASSIYDAIDYHDANGTCVPGLIVIASSGLAASSTTLSDAVDEAITEGIPVVLSAGNGGVAASGYVPASKGSVSGVICVGASDASRAIEGGSNFGTPSATDPPVDFYAPGDAVRVIDYSAPLGGGFGSFTGTSASAAYTGAVAASYLSVNPWSTPADLETALTGDAYTDGTSGLDILQLDSAGPDFYLDYDDWAAWFALADTTHTGDDDGDGWTNLEEFFHGLSPCTFEQHGSQVAISYDHASSKATFSFTISSVLLDASSLGTLLDGTTYEVTDTTTLASFATSGETLAVGGSTGGQTTLSQTASAVTECYLRVEYSPALPSP